MLGYVLPTEGAVLVHGRALDYSYETLTSWRKEVSMVSQDSPMFKRSIRENITYGMEGVTEAMITQALKDACIYDWVSGLENGLETILQFREKQLSGGQRQRIQLCRAFLSNSDIVFMVSLKGIELHLPCPV